MIRWICWQRLVDGFVLATVWQPVGVPGPNGYVATGDTWVGQPRCG